MNTIIAVQYGLSALHYAYSRGHMTIAEKLIAAKGNVDAKNDVSYSIYLIFTTYRIPYFMLLIQNNWTPLDLRKRPKYDSSDEILGNID